MKTLFILTALLYSTQVVSWEAQGLTKEERASLQDYELVQCSLPTNNIFGYGDKNYIPMAHLPVAQCEKMGGHAYGFHNTRKTEFQKNKNKKNIKAFNDELNF